MKVLRVVVPIVLLALVVATAAGWMRTSASGADRRGDADALAEENDELEAELRHAEDEAAAAADALDEASARFRPEALAALTTVQQQMVDARCAQGREAARNEADPPPTAEVVAFVQEIADQQQPALADATGWTQLLDLDAATRSAEDCHADELAIIEAERQAAAAAAEAAERAGNCDVPLFPDDYCPTDAELSLEYSAEALCGPGTPEGRAEAASLGIIC